MALLRFQELFHGGLIHRSERVDAIANLIAGDLRFGDGVPIGHRIVGRSQLFHRTIQFLTAGLVEEFQLGLLAYQFDFRLRALLAALVDCGAQRLQLLFASPQLLPHGGILRCHLIDPRFQRGNLFRQPGDLLIEFDVVGQQARPLLSQPFDLRRDGVAPRRSFAELVFEPAHGRPLAAMALFQTGQFRARGGVFFADSRGLAFEFLQLLPFGVQRFFALRPQLLLLLNGGAIALALLGGFVGIAAQPLQFQTRHRKARVDARQIVAQLAHLVIHRHAILLARLLQHPQPFQLGFEPDDLMVQAFEPIHLRRQKLLLLLERCRQFAHFALHGQRTGGRFLAACHGVPVIAHAIGHQEKEMRVGNREALRRRAIFRHEAQREPRQQIHRAIFEAVGEPQRVAQPRRDSGFGPDGRLRKRGFRVAVRLGMHQEGGAAVDLGADEIQPEFGLLPAFHHHVFQLFAQEFFGGLFVLRIHFHVVGQHAERLQVGRLAGFQRAEEALHRVRGVGAVHQHLLERILARGDLRHLALQAVDFAAQFHRAAATFRQILLGEAPLADYRFEFQLALRQCLGQLLASHFQALDFARGNLLFALRTGALALDAREILFDLRQLIFQRGGFAQQAQDYLAAGFDGLFALTHLGLQRLALQVDFLHAPACLRDLLLECRDVLLMSGNLLIERIQPHAEILRFLLGLRDALLHSATLAHLRFQPSAGAGGFHVQVREFLPLLGESVLDLIAGLLAALMLLLALAYLVGKRLEFVGREIEVDGRFGGVALEQTVFAGEDQPQARLQVGLELMVAFGLRRLPLQRVHLAGDLFQNVVHARQILLGAFQLRLREALASLELGDAGGLFDHTPAVLRLGAEDLPDASLFDDGVALGAETRPHENILDIAQARRAAVNEVFALPGTVQPPRDGDFAALLRPILHRLEFVGMRLVDVGIHQGHRDIRHAERLAVSRAGENHVFHARAAQRFRRLFA